MLKITRHIYSNEDVPVVGAKVLLTHYGSNIPFMHAITETSPLVVNTPMQTDAEGKVEFYVPNGAAFRLSVYGIDGKLAAYEDIPPPRVSTMKILNSPLA